MDNFFHHTVSVRTFDVMQLLLVSHKQVKTVFVDSLPASWDEEFVRGLLKKYGEIEKIELARNMPSAKRKDFGFVTFDTHDAAVSCAKSINNSELGEGDNKVCICFEELMGCTFYSSFQVPVSETTNFFNFELLG